MSFLEDLQKSLGISKPNNTTYQAPTPTGAPVPTPFLKTLNTALTPKPVVKATLKAQPVGVLTPKPKPFDAAGMAVNIIRTPFQAIAQGLHDTIGAVKGEEPSAFKATDPIGKFILGDKPLKTGQDYINENATRIQKSKEAGTPSWQSVPLSFLAFGGTIAGDASGLFGGEKKAGEQIFKSAFDDLVKQGVNITDETKAYNLLREAGVTEDIAKAKAPIVASINDSKVMKTILNDTAAEQIQTTQKLAQARLEELNIKAKDNILTHQELTEKNFLKKNINKPEELMQAYREEIMPSKPPKEVVQPIENTNTTTIKERKYITSTKASEDIAGDVSHEISENYNPKSNKELIEKSIARVSDNFDEAKKFALENSTDEAVATRVAVDKELSVRYANATSDVEKQALATELKDSIISHARLATEEGRTVQANALLGQQTPEGMLRTTSKYIDEYNKTARTKLPQISEANVKSVLEKSDEIAKMPEGLQKQVATKELVDELESLIPSPMWKKVVNVWKAGLLTGIKTSGVNIQSNFWNGVAEQVKNVPATGIDLATSFFTGKRTKALNLKGLFQGNKEGVKNGWNYLKTGVSEDAAKSGLEFNKVHFDSKPGKVLEAYAESVYRILGSEDMPFFYGALRRSLGEQALVTIKNTKKVFQNSDEKAKFIQNFIDNPSEEALALADLDAKVATFKNDTALGHMAQSIQNVPLLGPVAQMTVLPFAKTPSAVATAMLNYSPAGIVNTFYKTFKGGGFNQKEFAEGLGRVITGTGALWLGSELYKDGLVSLGYPDNEKERAEWEATGKIPNSIKIGDTWFPLIQFGPAGSILGIGGYYQKGKEETGSPAGGVVVGLFGGVKGLTEQTFLTGVQNLLKVVDDPENKAELYAGRVLGSVIPTVISDFAQAFDEYQRKSNDFLDPLKSRIPIVREELHPKLDVWGQRLERNRTAIATAISPIRLSNTIQGELNTEVERLAMAGEDIRPTKIDAKIGNVKLNDDEYYIFQRMYGDIIGTGLKALIENKEYQNKSPEEQAKLFKDGISDIKKGVGEIMLPNIIKKRYSLPDTINIKLATDLVDRLSKVSPEFNKASVEKQGKLILKILEE